MGWDTTAAESWCRKVLPNDTDLENCEILLSGIRDLSLFERRTSRKLKTYYMSERWFKPIAGFLPGWLRLLHPSFLHMAVSMRHVMRESDEFRYFAIGKWAKRDMRMICGGQSEKKMIPWGYFVEPSKYASFSRQQKSKMAEVCRVLWVGRLLYLKRVDVIVRAVSACTEFKRVDGSLPDITLDIYGAGPEEMRLKKLASGHDDIIKFHPLVSIAEVRRLMREHDVYVLASDAHEGWGAVVSEALEEGMIVLGTHEAGASATMLPKERLFSAGDVDGLVVLLRKAAAGEFKPTGIGEWSAANAAKRLLSI